METKRYDRQIRLDCIGLAGQALLRQAKVLCIGAGGIGSPLLLYLAAAGVGHIGIVDNDIVELENLHRQVLFATQDVQQKKVQIAKKRLLQANPDLIVDIHDTQFNQANALSLLSQYDIAADCTDNFGTRYLINDSCFAASKPFVYASLFQFQGQCSFFDPKNYPCFRCLFPNPPAAHFLDCNQAGVIGVVPGFLGILQATLILKWILKIDEELTGRLFRLDLNKLELNSVAFFQDPQCRLCVQRQYDFLNGPEVQSINAKELKIMMELNHRFVLLDVRTPQEFSQHNLGGLLIPLSELPKRYSELNKEALIIVYCQSGHRSKEAAKMLLAQQFKQIKFLSGGLNNFS